MSEFNALFASAEQQLFDIFGEQHELNGAQVRLMPRHRQGDPSTDENAVETGVLRQNRTFDALLEEIDPPVPGEEIDLDGDIWVVSEVEIIGGVAAITMFRDFA